VYFPPKVKGKVDPMLALEEYRRSRDVVPSVLNLGAGWR
jgi:hypothetical protein